MRGIFKSLCPVCSTVPASVLPYRRLVSWALLAFTSLQVDFSPFGIASFPLIQVTNLCTPAGATTMLAVSLLLWVSQSTVRVAEGLGSGWKVPPTCLAAEVITFSLSAVSLTSLLHLAVHTPSPPAQPPSARLFPVPSAVLGM